MMISSITEKQCMLEVKVSDQHCMDISVEAELLLADVSCWSSLSLSADIVGLCGMVQEMKPDLQTRYTDAMTHTQTTVTICNSPGQQLLLLLLHCTEYLDGVLYTHYRLESCW